MACITSAWSSGGHALKRNHDYYIQIQGQLYCSILDLKGIILTVYFGEDRPLFLEKICLDNTGPVTFCPRLTSSTEGHFTLSFLPNEYNGERFSTCMVAGWLFPLFIIQKTSNTPKRKRIKAKKGVVSCTNYTKCNIRLNVSLVVVFARLLFQDGAGTVKRAISVLPLETRAF